MDEELTKRDKLNLDIFWLKDDALEESANLPAPEIIAADIAIDLEAASEYAQQSVSGVGLAVRTGGDPLKMTAAIRQAVTRIDPSLPLYDVRAMPERVERSLDRRRTPMVLSLVLGFVALLLASVGIYGVLAYQVGQRSREIGIRLALGSDPAGILRLILREGIALVAAGLLLGVVGVVALRPAIASQLFGVGALDPWVLVSVVLVLGSAAAVACLAPAWRASRTDPASALSRQ